MSFFLAGLILQPGSSFSSYTEQSCLLPLSASLESSPSSSTSSQPRSALGRQDFGESGLSKGVGAVYRLRLLAPEVTGVKCKPGVYLSQSNMLCNREHWALCERLFGQQPQVQDYSALHPDLCGTKTLEVTGDGKANGPMRGTRRRGNSSWQTLQHRAGHLKESCFVTFIVSHENFLRHQTLEVRADSGNTGLLGAQTCFFGRTIFLLFLESRSHAAQGT